MFYNDFKDGYPLVLLAFMANTDLREFINYSREMVYKDVIPQLKDDDTIIKSIKLKLRRGEQTPAIELETEEQAQQFREQNDGKLFVRISKSSPGYNDQRAYAHNFAVGDYYVPYGALMPSHIKVFSGKTDAYWKDIEPKGRTFMIISIESGNKLRNAGANGEELTTDDINGKFIFTDGIDYMSNSDSDKLIYMEV